MVRTGRPPIYPWVDWFDGEHHALVHGVDFHGEPLVMQKQVQMAARRRGVLIATRRRGGTIDIGPRDLGFDSIDNSVTGMAPTEGISHG